jgi:hypothetical protein
MEAIPFDIAIGLTRSDKTADLHLGAKVHFL